MAEGYVFTGICLCTVHSGGSAWPGVSAWLQGEGICLVKEGICLVRRGGGGGGVCLVRGSLPVQRGVCLVREGSAWSEGNLPRQRGSALSNGVDALTILTLRPDRHPPILTRQTSPHGQADPHFDQAGIHPWIPQDTVNWQLVHILLE